MDPLSWIEAKVQAEEYADDDFAGFVEDRAPHEMLAHVYDLLTKTAVSDAAKIGYYEEARAYMMEQYDRMTDDLAKSLQRDAENER